ncbi:phosphoglycerate dehydrogenase [bacterium]|nr:phosphoglycerate dehydrogenase [bacterium]
MSKPKIFISTVPFGEFDQTPIELLDNTGWEYQINPLGRKLTAEEIGEFTEEYDGLIAGTEDIGLVLKKAKKLRVVARVGIGLDSVPLAECKKEKITVCYTPDAVTLAAAEFTAGLMLCGTRYIVNADKQLREGNWHRLQGRRLENLVIGLVGFGRIGSSVVRLLSGFRPKEIVINDLKDKTAEIKKLQEQYGLLIRQSSKEELYKYSDIVSLHVPLSTKTLNLINKEVFAILKPDAFLLNVARGGIVNESDLFDWLSASKERFAAMDVFAQEPYQGNLISLDNIILTQHMGSCSIDCRGQMELQATQDVINFFRGDPLQNEVPEEEYEYQLE